MLTFVDLMVGHLYRCYTEGRRVRFLAEDLSLKSNTTFSRVEFNKKSSIFQQNTKKLSKQRVLCLIENFCVEATMVLPYRMHRLNQQKRLRDLFLEPIFNMLSKIEELCSCRLARAESSFMFNEVFFDKGERRFNKSVAIGGMLQTFTWCHYHA